MTKENQTQQPVSGAMTDAEILAIYKRVINDQGKSLFEFARAVESALLSRAQDAQAIRNAALEEAKNICEAVGHAHKELKAGAYQCRLEITALQSTPAQPVERPGSNEATIRKKIADELRATTFPCAYISKEYILLLIEKG